MLYTKSLQILRWKIISMLKGLRVSSSAFKLAFHRPEHNAKGEGMKLNLEGLEMQKWNIPMGRAQRADKKIKPFV